MERAYVTAVARSLSQKGADEAAIVAGLVGHLEKTGRTKLLPRILRGLRAHLLKSAGRAPRIEIASEKERAQALEYARGANVSENAIVTNPSLLSGFRVRQDSVLTDRSGKRSLIELYRNITNA